MLHFSDPKAGTRPQRSPKNRTRITLADAARFAFDHEVSKAQRQKAGRRKQKALAFMLSGRL